MRWKPKIPVLNFSVELRKNVVNSPNAVKDVKKLSVLLIFSSEMLHHQLASPLRVMSLHASPARSHDPAALLTLHSWTLTGWVCVWVCVVGVVRPAHRRRLQLCPWSREETVLAIMTSSSFSNPTEIRWMRFVAGRGFHSNRSSSASILFLMRTATGI